MAERNGATFLEVALSFVVGGGGGAAGGGGAPPPPPRRVCGYLGPGTVQRKVGALSGVRPAGQL
jgi:hypothetical protein